jgi:hypothetical protein
MSNFPNTPDIDINNPSTIILRLQLLNQVLKNCETELTLLTYEMLKQQAAKAKATTAATGATAAVQASNP